MSDSFEVLAQAVGDNVLNDVLIVASETQIIISKIVITETAGGTPTYSVSVAKAGASDADKQYLAKDVSLTARQRVILGEGITLDETDVIRFDGSTSAVTIQIFGVKITNS